ncbi:MAG: GNAT family N-acetyltransferase [Saprospiraceae bacterium]|nr:GNAT family N-acetyltransferase [Saprospiraceae bacterium]
MNIEIRPATIADMPAVHALVRELAVYENAPEQHTATIEAYEKDFYEGIFEVQLAIDTDLTEGAEQIVGMIFYHFAYSTWRGRMMYLEDFVVTESYRQCGVGQLLFDRFLSISAEKGCVMTKWQVLDWNTPAVKFYEKNKATIEKEWWNGKISLINF